MTAWMAVCLYVALSWIGGSSRWLPLPGSFEMKTNPTCSCCVSDSPPPDTTADNFHLKQSSSENNVPDKSYVISPFSANDKRCHFFSLQVMFSVSFWDERPLSSAELKKQNKNTTLSPQRGRKTLSPSGGRRMFPRSWTPPLWSPSLHLVSFTPFNFSLTSPSVSFSPTHPPSLPSVSPCLRPPSVSPISSTVALAHSELRAMWVGDCLCD